jgi:Zn2+/Cd2+-exporting ATPase
MISSKDSKPSTDTHCGCSNSCSTVSLVEPSEQMVSTGMQHHFRIENMDCAVEESEIRHALKKVDGIQDLQFNLAERKLIITADATVVSQAIKSIQQIGYRPEEQIVFKGMQHHFRIENMDCAVEESEIRHVLKKVDGIQDLQFNLAERELIITADATVVSQAIKSIQQIGYQPEALKAEQEEINNIPRHFAATWAKPVFALVLALVAEALAFMLPESLTMEFVGMALALIAIGLSGFSVYTKGLSALRHGRLNINALMTVAVTGAFLIGQWPEAAMVMALYALAEMIESRAVDRARNAIKSLLALTPEQAEIRQADGSWNVVPVSSVIVGEIARVRPGERIPFDAIVTNGQSAIDQSPVTGESLPIDKTLGDDVYAGTINQTASLEIQVTAPSSNSTLTRIIHAVEQAQTSRAPMQRFVERFAAIYTPAVFVLALLVFVLMPLFTDLNWIQSMYKALVLLVISCPCALVISTPVTVVSGLAAGARRGILIKGGAYIEDARKIKVVALDKTGTITEGKPQLVAFESLDLNTSSVVAERIAKSLAARSDHPVSKAISAGLSVDIFEVSEFQAVPGRGVEGVIDGSPYVLGNHRWIEERGQCSTELEARLKIHEEAGRTVTILANAHQVIALCAVADTIKPSSAQAISELKSLGVTPVMLSGDNIATVRTVAAEAGIGEIRGNLLPEDKLQAITELQNKFGVTAMAGDGINDAPALAQADIGFAMGGSGTHIAMEAADVVVMNDDLRRLPETIRLSKRTHKILWQNIALALGIKLVFLLLAIFDNASMWMAVFADMGASLLVIGNGLRLLRQKN